MKVIESTTMFEQYVHGYHSQENQRLHDQAGTLVELLHGDTSFPPGASVLEIGCESVRRLSPLRKEAQALS